MNFANLVRTSKTGIINIGGMVNGHMPETYYFLANDYLHKLKAS